MASSTGWTIEYILYKVNYQTLIMMLSDAPRYIDSSDSAPSSSSSDTSDRSAEDEANEIVGFYQSNLNK